jgi:hypothetical protein
MRRFARVKGVVDIGTAETPKKRRYRVLRIPRTVVERWVLEHGGRIAVDIPTPTAKAKSGKPTPQTAGDDIIRDLAVVAHQHGHDAHKTLERIARRIKTMTFVPADQWLDMVWLDEEDD